MIRLRKYTTIYFDLDNTLLDFTATEHRAILQLLGKHNLSATEQNAKLYSSINDTYWKRFERGEIEKKEIFEGRFKTLLEYLGETRDTKKMADDYFALLACGHDCMKGAKEILEYLKGRGYVVYITTNGVAFTQYKRIDECGLKQYFDAVFVSEEAGSQKPDKEYFEFVMNNSKEKDKSKIIIIGDSQSSDILGGANFGVDTCWFNPKGATASSIPTYEIRELCDLKQIL